MSIGRSVMLLWMGDASVHELYTAACGLYIIWLVCRVGSVLVSWVPLGWKGVAMKFFEWFLLVSYLYLHCLFRVRHIRRAFDPWFTNQSVGS